MTFTLIVLVIFYIWQIGGAHTDDRGLNINFHVGNKVSDVFSRDSFSRRTLSRRVESGKPPYQLKSYCKDVYVPSILRMFEYMLQSHVSSWGFPSPL